MSHADDADTDVDVDDDDAIELSKWFIFFISTEEFFFSSWSWLVFLTFALISSLVSKIIIKQHYVDDLDNDDAIYDDDGVNANEDYDYEDGIDDDGTSPP